MLKVIVISSSFEKKIMLTKETSTVSFMVAERGHSSFSPTSSPNPTTITASSPRSLMFDGTVEAAVALWNDRQLSLLWMSGAVEKMGALPLSLATYNFFVVFYFKFIVLLGLTVLSNLFLNDKNNLQKTSCSVFSASPTATKASLFASPNAMRAISLCSGVYAISKVSSVG
jgi:hypothetical protein